MATTITGIGQAKVLNALDTYNHTVASTALYNVSLKLTEVPPSGCTIVIQQNGSQVASASAPAATQNQVSLATTINCTASDVISVILASSSVIDQQKNTIKAILNIHIGSV